MGKKLNKSQKLVFCVGLVLLVLLGGGVFAFYKDKQSVAHIENPSQTQEILGDTIDKQTVIEFEEIPFKEKTVEDASLAEGESYVKTKGQKGKKTVTYMLTLHSDSSLTKDVVSEEVTKKPVDQVKVVGTSTYTAPQTLGAQTTEQPSSPAPKPEPKPEPIKLIHKVVLAKRYYCLQPGNALYDELDPIETYENLDECRATLPHA